MRIIPNNTLFVMIDIQEKFSGVIDQLGEVIKNASILNQASQLLEIPLIVTEQYPKGLGHTITDIVIPASAQIFEKKSFSIFNQEISAAIPQTGKTTLVLYGIETHICLYQSALDALLRGYQVYFVADAVSSRKKENKEIAIRRLEKLGAEIVSTEMLLFELMQSADHPAFKQISGLVK